MRKMRGYVPPSAPLQFEPCTGDEKGLRLVAGFTTRWFHERCGAEFGAAFHKDPCFRFEQIMKMEKYVRGVFPEIPCFSEHDPVQESATITGVYATCPVAMAYGMHPIFKDDDWPAIHPKERFTLEQISSLKPFDVENLPVTQDLLRQIDILQREWGMADGYLNYQGVLNTAFKLFGDEVFLYMISEPEEMEAVFSHIVETTNEMIRIIQTAQRNTGFLAPDVGFCLCLGECVVNLISPDFYREMLLHQDQKIYDALDLAGVHTCNWNVDKHLDAIASLGELGYLDFGFVSDLEKIQEKVPDTRKLVFYTPAVLVSKTDREIKEDVRKIKRTFDTCDIGLIDMDLNTPDDRIKLFYELICQVDEEETES